MRYYQCRERGGSAGEDLRIHAGQIEGARGVRYRRDRLVGRGRVGSLSTSAPLRRSSSSTVVGEAAPTEKDEGRICWLASRLVVVVGIDVAALMVETWERVFELSPRGARFGVVGTMVEELRFSLPLGLDTDVIPRSEGSGGEGAGLDGGPSSLINMRVV